jgi:hypothetical protein
MRKSFLIYEEMRKYFPIYKEAISHILLCNCFTLNFPIYDENLIFFFVRVPVFLLFISPSSVQVPYMVQDVRAYRVAFLVLCLKGLSHEMDLAFGGQF